MKDKGQMRGIAAFVATNPGCFCHEVIAGTGIQKCAVTSALIKLVKRGTLWRVGNPKHYRYFIATKAEVIVNDMAIKPGDYDHDRPNPLSAMFNQKLREVRR
ncbi:TPA: hypothetical protein G8O32_002773 [Salmonella enterica]|uniref:MarR family transcriptional regulator n=1 Tax=Salmonella enterica TaxID=28901 RepID=A0A759NS30_SALER|nr:hypothetical protein [Salmonella enterica subsp. enterica serovar Newport]ECH3770763.1 hypothetical protein [Salmonella enterica subsp. enterica]HAG2010512.1 hypothetical protein [Salmonella enterica]